MQHDRTFTYYWDMLMRRHLLLIGVFFGVTALVFLVGSRQRPQYQASASLLVSQDGSASDPMALFSNATGLGKRPVLVNHLEILKSYAIARMVFDTLPEPVQRQVQAGTRGDPALLLQRLLSVRPVRDADIIRLSVLASSPELAKTLAAAYVAAYRAFNLNRSRADVSAIREFVGTQLAVVGARLDSSERRQESYKQANRVADIGEETKATVARQSEVLALLGQARVQAAGVKQEIDYLGARLESLGAGAGLENVASPVVAGLRVELGRLEAERTNLLVQGFPESSPRVAGLAGRVKSLQARLGAELDRFVSAGGALNGMGRVEAVANRLAELEPERVRLSAAVSTLEAAARSYDGELSALPARERSLARLTRDVEVDRQVYVLLAQRYEESRIQEAGRVSTVGLVDVPRSGVQVRPNHRNDAVMAVLLGLLLALSSVLAVDYLDTTVRRPEDLERQGFSVLASVPRIEASDELRVTSDGSQVAAGPISSRQSGSIAAEAFRVLRTNLQFAAAGREAKTMMVTSPGAGEGKSMVASNLAAVMAQSGKRMLLIDCDLRRPKQHKLFEQRKKPGLTDVAMLGVPLESAAHRANLAPDTSNSTPEAGEADHGALSGGHEAPGVLDVLFAGTTPPSPVDFLNSKAFASFLEKAAGQYDCVVLDTPPVLVSADAAILASKVSGVVLVARMRKTDWRALGEAKKLLAQAGANVLGVLANELRLSRGYGYYRYKYRYYHYRYQQPAAG
jgi:succinoglycan biosynthesis transport protein ExoP